MVACHWSCSQVPFWPAFLIQNKAMNTLIPTSPCNFCDIPSFFSHRTAISLKLSATKTNHRLRANSNDLQTQAVEEPKQEENGIAAEPQQQTKASSSPALEKDLKKVCYLCWIWCISWSFIVFSDLDRYNLMGICYFTWLVYIFFCGHFSDFNFQYLLPELSNGVLEFFFSSIW